jgi:Fe-S-cluster containining protein
MEAPRFECTGCGECCSWPGFVPLTLGDRKRLEKVIPNVDDYIEQRSWFDSGTGKEYAMPVLRKHPDTNGCVLLAQDGKTCTVWDYHPVQCRTYPWWPKIRGQWSKEAYRCEGIGRGEPRDPEEIEWYEKLYEGSEDPEGTPWPELLERRKG